MCRGASPELFFSATPNTDRSARRLCQECPVRQPCLMTAMLEEAAEERRFGIFGGLDPGERHRLARSGVTGPVAAARFATALRMIDGAA